MNWLWRLFLTVLITSGQLSAIGQVPDQADQDQVAPDQADPDATAEVAEEAVEMAAPAQGEVDNQQLDTLKQYVKSQISFVNTVLLLSDQQRQQLEQLDEGWLRQSMRKFGQDQNNIPQGGGLLRIFGIGQAAVRRPMRNEGSMTNEIKRQLDQKINELLNEDQRAVLQSETQAKVAFKEEALAELTVSLIERHLYLSPQQTQQLPPLLKGKVNSNCGWVIYLHNQQYLPNLQRCKLTDVLTEDQTAIIRGLPQHDFVEQEQNFLMMLGINLFEE